MSYVFGPSSRRQHGTSLGGNTGARPFAQPGAVQLVMAGSGTKVPQNRLVILGQEGETGKLVHGPGTDMGSSDIAYVVHIEAEQRTQFRILQYLFDACQSLVAQPFKVCPF